MQLKAADARDGQAKVAAVAKALASNGVTLKDVKAIDANGDGWLDNEEFKAAGLKEKGDNDGWRGQFINIDVDISLSST